MIDRGGDQRRHIAQLQVQLMIEPRQARDDRRTDLGRLMALQASALRGPHVITRMAAGALQLRRQMDAMREGLRRCGGGHLSERD